MRSIPLLSNVYWSGQDLLLEFRHLMLSEPIKHDVWQSDIALLNILPVNKLD